MHTNLTQSDFQRVSYLLTEQFEVQYELASKVQALTCNKKEKKIWLDNSSIDGNIFIIHYYLYEKLKKNYVN